MWLSSLRGEVPGDAASTVEGSDAASEVASVSAASWAASSAAPPPAQLAHTVARAKKEMLEAANKTEDNLNRMRAFEAEAPGDQKTQKAFQLMADYSDQFFSDHHFTMNMY